MNIAVLARWVSRNFTGVFEVSRRLAQSSAEIQGDSVKIFGIEDEFTKADSKLWSPLDVQTFSARGGGFAYAPELSKCLCNDPPDVIHVHGIWTYTGVAAWECKKQSGAPYLISPHGMFDTWAVSNSKWKKRVARLLYEEKVQSQAACLHATTKMEYEVIRQYGRKNPICIIPYGIDIPKPNQHDPAPWGKVVPSGAKTILFMGRFHPKKGCLPLLKGWKKWINENARKSEEWHLILVGYDEGGHEKELRDFVTSESLERTVHFIPPQFGDLRSAAYYNCDAFILPSFSEGLPTAVLLAWAHEKPVIITEACNLADKVSEGAGLLIEPEADSIALGLNSFVDMSENDRAVMGKKGLEIVKRDYVWSEVAQQTRDVYQWMLGGGDKPESVSESLRVR